MTEITEAKIKSMTKEQNYMHGYIRGYRDGESDMLDNIRPEIEQLAYYWCEVNPKPVIDNVLQIIDKYKIEREE